MSFFSQSCTDCHAECTCFCAAEMQVCFRYFWGRTSVGIFRKVSSFRVSCLGLIPELKLKKISFHIFYSHFEFTAIFMFNMSSIRVSNILSIKLEHWVLHLLVSLLEHIENWFGVNMDYPNSLGIVLCKVQLENKNVRRTEFKVDYEVHYCTVIL